MTTRSTRPHGGLFVLSGLVAYTGAVLASVPFFPLAAPVAAVAGMAGCLVARRRYRRTLVTVLLALNAAALVFAGVIDLFLLDVSGDQAPPPT